jgi:hypothetical protein
MLAIRAHANGREAAEMPERGLQHQPAAKKQIPKLLTRRVAEIKATQGLRMDLDCDGPLLTRGDVGINKKE